MSWALGVDDLDEHARSIAALVKSQPPVSMLDMRQAENLIAQLRKAEGRATQPIDPALPLQMARARRDVERAFAALKDDETWWREAARSGLVAAGLNAIARWLKA